MSERITFEKVVVARASLALPNVLRHDEGESDTFHYSKIEVGQVDFRIHPDAQDNVNELIVGLMTKPQVYRMILEPIED